MDLDLWVFVQLSGRMAELADKWTRDRKAANAKARKLAQAIGGPSAWATYNRGEGEVVGIWTDLDKAFPWLKETGGVPKGKGRYWAPRLNTKRGKEFAKEIKMWPRVPSVEDFVRAHLKPCDHFGFSECGTRAMRARLNLVAGHWVVCLPNIERNRKAKLPRGAKRIPGSAFRKLIEKGRAIVAEQATSAKA